MPRATEGTKSECRHCGRPVIFKKVPDSMWRNLRWLHSDNDEGTCQDATNPFLQISQPKHYCVYEQNEGDRVCNRSIKGVDIEAELWACGIHMKQEVADRERRERQAKRVTEEEARKEFEAWELEVYKGFERSLRTWLGDELFGDEHVTQKYYSRTEVLHKQVQVGWYELHTAVINLIAGVKEEVSHANSESGDVQRRGDTAVSGV